MHGQLKHKKEKKEKKKTKTKHKQSSSLGVLCKNSNQPQQTRDVYN
jgi:hypothetical protein